MEHIFTFLLGTIVLATVVILMLWVTWLFVERLRKRKPVARSFLRWLLDLFDIVSGIG